MSEEISNITRYKIQSILKYDADHKKIMFFIGFSTVIVLRVMQELIFTATDSNVSA